MTITTFQQTKHPEIGSTVNEVNQKVVYDNYNDYYNACQVYKKSTDKKDESISYLFFKNYFKQGLTPLQAVKKYFS